MKIRTAAIVLCFGTLALLLVGVAPRDPRLDPTRGSHESDAPSTKPTSAPAATRPVIALLLGEYRGTVVDDDETVPCVTRFDVYRGKISGVYAVREGKDRFEGTLEEFKLISNERGECRFRWRDKHGTGFVTIRVAPDGSSFAGSWGLEVVQDELIWNGTRVGPTTRRVRPGSEHSSE